MSGLVRAIAQGRAVHWLLLHGHPRRAWRLWKFHRKLRELY